MARLPEPASGVNPEGALWVKFWSKVAVTDDPDECWVWLAGKNKWGYGYFSHRPAKMLVRAHRLCWVFTRGPIPKGLFVLHNCPNGEDNRACVNPNHLWLGTHVQNMADMVRKGRSPTGDRNNSRLHPERLRRGDAHPARQHPERLRGARRPHLRPDEVRQIRRRRVAGESLMSIAVDFGVSENAISEVVSGKTWANVPMED